MSEFSSIEKSLEAATRVFADNKDMFLRRVVVPTKTADAQVSFRRDAMSDNRLVLELALEQCGECPAIPPLTSAGSASAQSAPFFQSETPCVSSTANDGTVSILSNMRCQHFVVKNSPRAFASALRQLQTYLATESTSKMYVESAKRQIDAVQRYALGEPVAPASVGEMNVALLSDQVRQPLPWPYIYGVIGVLAIALVVVVALLVARTLERKQKSTRKVRAAQAVPLMR